MPSSRMPASFEPVAPRPHWMRDFARSNGLAVALVCGGVFLAPFNKWQLTPNIKYCDVFFAAAAAAAAMESFRHPRAIRLPLSFLLALPLLAFAGLIDYYDGDNPADMSDLLHFVVAAFLLPLIMGWTTSSSVTAVRTVVIAWVFGASANAVIVALNRHGYYPLNSWDGRIAVDGRYGGLATFPNESGAFCAMVLPVLMMWFLDRRGARFVRLAAAPLFLLNFYAVQLSGSRAAFLAALAGTMVYCVYWVRLQPVRGTLSIAAVLLVLLVGTTVSNCLNQGSSNQDCTVSAWDRLFGGAGAEASDQERLGLLSHSLDLVADAPLLGIGFHAVRASHNIFLQILVSSGVVGMLGFLLYLGTALSWYFRIRPRHGDPLRLGYLVPALYGGFAAWIAAGMFQPFTIGRSFYVPIGLLLALRIYCANQPLRRPAPESLEQSGSPAPV